MSNADVLSPDNLHGLVRSGCAPALEVDMLVEFGRIGFHPFILVKYGQASAEGSAFIACKTQNEAPEFVNTLGSLPRFTHSKLVRGIERALQLEIYDAAELLFQWTKQPTKELAEVAHLGLPDETELPYYAGYPVFTMASKATPISREARVQILKDIFEAYRSTHGNDALRFALIEALGLALSRALGSLGSYEEAAQYVGKATEFHTYSIYLKAARHAIELKLGGKPVPDRLAKFIGEDNGHLKQFVCPEPFKRFDIGPSGDVLVCCGHWLPTSIGNFVNSPIEEVLNSPWAQKLRRSMTDGSYKYCNHLECGSMIQGTLPRREELKDPQILNAIVREDFHVDGVEQILFALDRTCNLSCPSCRQERISEKVSESEEKAKAVEQKLLPLLPTLRILNINPAGELFASKPSRRLLELINEDSAPNLVLDIISNGTLFSEDEWNKFPGIHNKIRSVRVSIDAAKKETFEKLRRLGKYEVFLENMRFLRSLRARGVIPQFKFSFTYQRDNFREMREFVNFCGSMNADFAIFERLQNLGAFTDAEYRDRAVHHPDHPLYADFLDVVRDPMFRNKQVWHDFDYPGVENMSAEDARSRLNEALTIQSVAASREGATAAVPIAFKGRARSTLPSAQQDGREISAQSEPATESRIEKEKFIYIAAMPKSASSLAWAIASSLQESGARANASRQKGQEPGPFMPLQRGLLELFPEGGTYKSHAPLSFDTAHMLEDLECKYVVLLRHPADFLSALYCHTADRERSNGPGGRTSLPWTYALSPMRRSAFMPSTPIDEAMAHLIRDGALFGVLEWMAQWRACRDETQSVVITTEDLVERLDQTVTKLSHFIRQEPPTEDVCAYLRHVAKSEAEKGAKNDPAKYPRGWTGKVGTWRDYFSEQNVKLYNKTVGEFLSCHPFASGLETVYPELRIRAPKCKRTTAALQPANEIPAPKA